MDFFETIEKRHSYRGLYEDSAVPESDLVKILDAGIRAPSGHNAQSTSFFVVTNNDLIKEISELFKYNKKTIATASAIIVVATRKITFNHIISADYELEDYGAAVQNILLAVTALGYASVWLDGECRLDGADKALAKLLDISDELKVRTILPIGIPQKIGKQTPRKPFDERVIWKK